MKKYIDFLEGLKPANPMLVESITKAYRIIFEEVAVDMATPPKRMTFAEIKAARNASTAAPSQSRPASSARGWENSGKDLNKWVLKIKEGGYPVELVGLADELITTLATIVAHDKKINVKTKDGRVEQQSVKPIASTYHGKLEGALKSVPDRADNESVGYLSKFLNSLKSATDAISIDSYAAMPDKYVDNGEYDEDEDDYDVSI